MGGHSVLFRRALQLFQGYLWPPFASLINALPSLSIFTLVLSLATDLFGVFTGLPETACFMIFQTLGPFNTCVYTEIL